MPPRVRKGRRQQDQKHPSLRSRLAKLAARGILTLPTRRPLKRVRMAKITGPPISRTIIEDRR